MEQEKLTSMQAYKIGDIINYKVKSLFTNYCELIDEETDITSYLQGTAKLVLFKGQTVKCRVLAVNEKHPKIELVDISAFAQSNDNLTEDKLTDLLSSRAVFDSATFSSVAYSTISLLAVKTETSLSNSFNFALTLFERVSPYLERLKILLIITVLSLGFAFKKAANSP